MSNNNKNTHSGKDKELSLLSKKKDAEDAEKHLFEENVHNPVIDDEEEEKRLYVEDVYGSGEDQKKDSEDTDDDDDDDETHEDKEPVEAEYDDEADLKIIDIGKEDDDDDDDDDDEDDGIDDEKLLKLFDSDEYDDYDDDDNPEEEYEKVAENQFVSNPADRITFPILSVFESVILIGHRIQQLVNGSVPLVDTRKLPPLPEGASYEEYIATHELLQRVIPFKVKRPLPNGKIEIWDISELSLCKIYNE